VLYWLNNSRGLICEQKKLIWHRVARVELRSKVKEMDTVVT